MDLEAKKLGVLQKIMNVDKESLLSKIDQILDDEMVVAYTIDGDPLTKSLYNERLEIAEKQIAQGQTISQEDLEKESDNW
ncbi:MAG: hypothetical protein AAFQ94_22295 [Bacteroidota bacterium]